MTEQQAKLLAFITARLADGKGVPPSYDEMAEHMGFASKSGIHRLVSALVERGHLRRKPHQARSVMVVKCEIDHAREVLERGSQGKIDPLDAIWRALEILRSA